MGMVRRRFGIGRTKKERTPPVAHTQERRSHHNHITGRTKTNPDLRKGCSDIQERSIHAATIMTIIRRYTRGTRASYPLGMWSLSGPAFKTLGTSPLSSSREGERVRRNQVAHNIRNRNQHPNGSWVVRPCSSRVLPDGARRGRGQSSIPMSRP